MATFKKALYRQALGQVIREYRLERGLTLRNLSIASTVSLGYLSEIETGRKEVSSEILNCVASALSIGLHELIVSAGYRIGELQGTLTPTQLLEQELSYVS